MHLFFNVHFLKFKRNYKTSVKVDMTYRNTVSFVYLKRIHKRLIPVFLWSGFVNKRRLRRMGNVWQFYISKLSNDKWDSLVQELLQIQKLKAALRFCYRFHLNHVGRGFKLSESMDISHPKNLQDNILFSSKVVQLQISCLFKHWLST